jgi:lipoprotein-releasing system ATP-binding protein
VLLDGVDASTLSRRRRDRARCREIGFVFQFYHLLPELSVLENTLLPAKVDSSILQWPSRGKGETQRAMAVLEHVGLSDRIRHRPKELSGGERQRVAIARALMNRPRLLLADEPTGNLDSKTGRQIMMVLRDAARESGATVIMVTHDAELAAQSDRVLRLVDGRLAE